MKKMSFNTTKRNQKHQKQKNDKIFKKMTKKKKTLLCYNALNTFQMYSNECQ